MATRGLAIGELKIALELPSNEAVLCAAADGELVAAVSELAAAPLVAAGRVVRLAVGLDRRQFDLLTHKERRLSAAAAFVGLLEPSPSGASVRT